MKLNIHFISHPLTQNLSSISSNISSQYSILNQSLKYLGLFIIYETIRTWTIIYKLKIKTNQKKKDFIIIDPKESYTIIFNSLDYISMLQEIQFILPKIDLKLIEYKDKEKLNLSYNTHHKILIINNKMDAVYTKNVIEDLKYTYNINLNQIRLACIECATTQLIKLSEKYNNLTIYTTKIIDT